MEIWKDVPGYEDYQVSSRGRVKSFKYGKERILISYLNIKGYYQIFLNNNEGRKSFKIHKLVAMAFLDHISNGYESVIDHINGITTDNRLQNLRIVSNRKNTSLGYIKKNTTSQYTGVSWYEERKKWRSQIHLNGKNINLGLFECEISAANAYNKALKELNKQKI